MALLLCIQHDAFGPILVPYDCSGMTTRSEWFTRLVEVDDMRLLTVTTVLTLFFVFTPALVHLYCLYCP